MAQHNAKKKFSLWTVVMVLAALVMVGAAAGIVWQLLAYRQGTDTYAQAQQQYTVQATPAPAQSETQAPAFVPLEVDFAALQAETPQVIGWIDVDALDISYPVVQAENNEYYLTHLWTGAANSSGSIFMDAANTGWDDQHVIVYGHNMRNRSMFGSLREYRSEEFYAENGGWLTLYTADGEIWRYQIFGAKQVATADSVYTVGFVPGEEYTAFLKQLCRGRFYETGVAVYSNDHVLTLSTCVGDDTQRLVVTARRAQRYDPATGQLVAVGGEAAA